MVVVAISFLSWQIFIPKYEYHHYKIDGCQDGDFTVVVYSKIGERGLMLAKGIQNDMPANNYIIDREFSGFDAYFDVVATCEKGQIVINYHAGYFDPKHTSSEIIPKRVDYDTYDSLKSSDKAKHIYLN